MTDPESRWQCAVVGLPEHTAAARPSWEEVYREHADFLLRCARQMGVPPPGANPTLEAPFGWGSSVFNDSGASFDVGVDRVRLELSMGGASITLPLPIEEPAPMLETVADGGFGGMPLAWDPAQPEVSAEACDYCGGGLWRLEGEFIVDGGSIGWSPSFQSQVVCN